MDGNTSSNPREQVWQDTGARPSENPRASPSGLTKTEQKRAAYTTAAGSGLETLAGMGVIALSIIGLAGVFPFVCAAVSAIVVGGGFLLEGLAIAGAYAEEVRHTQTDTHEASIIGGGMSVQVLGGAAGITLGILALAGVVPWTLLAISAIVFGGTLLFGGTARAELNDAQMARGGSDRHAQHMAAQALNASSGALSLAGIAAATLGILGLISVGSTATLVLVGLLIVGGANLLGGSALVTRVATSLR